MATPGTPWICDNSLIVAALKKWKGRLTYACEELGVHYVTLKVRVDSDPELTKLVSDLRNNFENRLLDLAENVVEKSMENQDTDPTNALKSAFFTLNSRGAQRNWTNTLTLSHPLDSLASLKEKIISGEITQPEKPS